MSRNESGQLEPGTTLAGRYQIERFLAGGGMGVVYIAQDQRLAERRVAIKEIFDRFTNPEERAQAIEYFHREADTLAQLTHPAIPAIFDRFGEGNCHYLVMDFVEGVNLEQEIAGLGGRLPESRVIEIGRELCDVLTYLHGFSPPIIYRDMKPGNVILGPDGRITLIDFGIARIFSPQGKATLIGTPGFAPPEQYSGQVDERSDLYGLAATLHYILTGRDPEKHPPFSCPPVLSEKPDASPFLAQAIDQALAYKAEERPKSAEAFKDMFLYGRGLSAAPSPSSSQAATQILEPLPEPVEEPLTVAPPQKKRRWGRMVAALVFLLLMTGGAYGLLTSPELLQGNPISQLGEKIPWQQLETWLPESRRAGFRAFVADLPWEREKRLRALRADPLELVSLNLLNTSRDGTPRSEAKASYTVGEVQYLTWEAVLKNRLSGVEGGNYRIEGRFFDPEGGLAGKSEAGRFVRPEEEQLELRGVTLLEGLKERATGDYQLELYFGDAKLASQTVRIEADPVKVAKADAEEGGVAGGADVPAVIGPTPEEERAGRAAEEKRLALIQERSKEPLSLVSVRFFNTAKDGSRLSQSASSFGASKLRFVAWEADFQNQLHDLLPSYHRVTATYYAPNGQILGTVEEGKEVSDKAEKVTFTARIGNASGSAFSPGDYKVDFYVNGYPLSPEKFTVTDDRDLAHILNSHQGSILGLGPEREVPLEVHFQPHSNGVLRGNLVIHATGFGAASLEGSLQDNNIDFQSRIGNRDYHFRGWREENRLSGTYSVGSSESVSGHWSLQL